MTSIKIGQVFRARNVMSVWTTHPDDFREILTGCQANKADIDLAWTLTKSIWYERDLEPVIGMVVYMEPGITFDFVESDFIKQNYTFANVMHYMLLIADRVYWQSFKCEQDFFRVWENFN